jgi:hypothetical protein
MNYIPLFGAIVLFIVADRARRNFAKARASDYAAIEEFAAARSLRIISVCRNDNHWRYWLRGKLSLSNVARVFIVVVEPAGVGRRELHIAFDDWRGSRTLRLPQDIPVSR